MTWCCKESGVGVTKALFINFSVSKISILQKYLLDPLNHIHIWQAVTPVKHKHDI